MTKETEQRAAVDVAQVRHLEALLSMKHDRVHPTNRDRNLMLSIKMRYGDLTDLLAILAAQPAPESEGVDLAKVDAVIAEMIEVAVDEDEDFDRGTIDVWQSQLQQATGHTNGFPSRPTPLPTDPIACPDGVGWLVEENVGLPIHWIALETDNWPRTKISRIREDYDVVEYQSPVRRVKDAGEALRFSRKQDAEAFIALFGKFLLHPVATQHQWAAALSPSSPVEGDAK